ncbi:MAG: DUF4129 domain-containing protein [Chloroflexi bacterium]|nr:DUF4129 domain-containing protein [Chloroflexota bacterium]
MTRSDGDPERSAPRKRTRWFDFALPEFHRERNVARRGGLARAFEPACIVLCVGLYTQGLLQFGLIFGPDWRVGGVLPVALALAVVAHRYADRLTRPSVIWREWIVLFVPFAVAVRLTPFLSLPADTFSLETGQWLSDPTAIFDIGYLLVLTVLVGVWLTSFHSTLDIAAARIQTGEIVTSGPRPIDRAWDADRVRTIDHTSPVRRLARRFLGGGIALAFCASVTALGAEQRLAPEVVIELFLPGRPSSTLAYANLMIYYVTALLLVSYAVFVRDRTIWALDNTWLSGAIGRHWMLSACGLLTLAACLAFVLPTEGLLSLSEVFLLLFGALFQVASSLILIAYLIFWVVTYPLRLLSGSAEEIAAPARGFEAPPTLVSPESDTSLFDAARTVAIWGVLGIAILYSASNLWTRRAGRGVGSLLAAVRSALGALIRAIVLLVSFARRAGTVAMDAARHAIRGGPDRVACRRPVIGGRPGREPRQTIIALYGLLLARAERRGIVRRRHETAIEFKSVLDPVVPDEVVPLSDLTEAFLVARYGAAPVAEERARGARSAWRRLQSALVRVRVPRR